MKLHEYLSYDEMKHPWLGKIPKEWALVPNRSLFVEIKDTGHIEEGLLSVTISRGVIEQKNLLQNTSKKDSSNLDKSKYKLVLSGDIVYNKMRAWQGAIGLSKRRGIVSPAYIVLRPTRDCNPEFFHYLFRTPHFAKEAERWSYGITSDQWSLRYNDFRKIYSCLPSLWEQNRIVAFIRCKSAQINKYIRIKKRQIELLKELKQVIINDAVTGKIDVRTGKPYPKYKDSGIDWLGMIPEDWKCKRLKEFSKVVLGKMLKSERSDGDELKFYLRSANIQWMNPNVNDVNSMWFNTREMSLYRISKHDILVSEGGEVGRACIWSEELPECYIQNSVHKITTSPDVLPLYLLYSFTEKAAKGFFTAFVNRVSIGHLTREKIVSIPFIIPSIHTQNCIVEYILQFDNKIETMIDTNQSQINGLKELQTRLISDAVIGKLDVRDIEVPDIPKDVLEHEYEVDEDPVEEIENAD